MPRSKAIRAAAWGVVAAGVLAPLVRRRVKAPPVVMQTAAFAAPLGLSVAVRRSRGRDVAICALQMWAYLAAYETPHDDVERQLARTHIDYPIAVDRVLGLGRLPTERLQRALARSGPAGPEWRALDSTLVWAHWIWFLVPHTALAYIFVRYPERFPRAAVLTYAVFDIGATFYWLLPTAPPWYAAGLARGELGSSPLRGHSPVGGDGSAENGSVDNGSVDNAAAGNGAGSGEAPWGDAPRSAGALGGEGWRAGTRRSAPIAGRGMAAGAIAMPGHAGAVGDPGALAGSGGSAAQGWPGEAAASASAPTSLAVRRMMVEYGEGFWQDGWGPMFSALGGNPFAAMPSLHCATSVTAAILLSETGPVAGAVGWGYAAVLGFALVYLGEHYVVDLIAGAALTGVVYGLAPRATPAIEWAGRMVRSLEARAHEA